MSSTLPLIRVLVVNEQREMCELWQRMMDMEPGLTCPAYTLNGDEVLPLVNQQEPDVVFMDMQIAGVAGDEVARQVLEKHPEAIIILHSAYANLEQQAYEAGAVEFVVLPIPPDKLASIIRRVYREHQKPDA